MMKQKTEKPVEKTDDEKEPFFGDCHLVEVSVEEKGLNVVDQVILKQPVAAYYF